MVNFCTISQCCSIYLLKPPRRHANLVEFARVPANPVLPSTNITAFLVIIRYMGRPSISLRTNISLIYVTSSVVSAHLFILLTDPLFFTSFLASKCVAWVRLVVVPRAFFLQPYAPVRHKDAIFLISTLDRVIG